jgi:hypothetical protein
VTPLREAVFDAANAVQAAGIRVVVVGIFPFSDGGAFAAGWWPTLEQRRTTYNQWAAYMYGNAYVDLTWCLHETTATGPTRAGSATDCTPPASVTRSSPNASRWKGWASRGPSSGPARRTRRQPR